MSRSKEFFDAVYQGDVARVRALVNDLGPVTDASGGVYALRRAVERNYGAVVVAFFEAGVTPNVRDDAGATPLMWAVTSNNVRLAKDILARGGDPNAADRLGWTALFHAAAGQDLEMVSELLKEGADATKRDWEGKTAAEVARYRRFAFRLPIIGYGSGQYRTLRDTPVRSLLKRHIAQARGIRHG